MSRFLLPLSTTALTILLWVGVEHFQARSEVMPTRRNWVTAADVNGKTGPLTWTTEGPLPGRCYGDWTVSEDGTKCEMVFTFETPGNITCVSQVNEKDHEYDVTCSYPVPELKKR